MMTVHIKALPGQTLRALNVKLRYMGFQLVRTSRIKPWDKEFQGWVKDTRASGVDPNDIGDRAWQDNALENCSRHLFPHVSPESTVLELGPGTGRYTRHVFPRCREMILVDYSEFVCGWVREYLKGKGHFQIHHIERPALPQVSDESVDFVFAIGVFEHIDVDETDSFLQEFHRVLKPGGALSFNFDNFMSPGGLHWFRNETMRAGARRIFRFYHPEFLQRMARMRGFDDVVMTTDDTRFAFLSATKRRFNSTGQSASNQSADVPRAGRS
jgi:ubiquinone/menaquinone biosynthesis C-methylase UbiE